MEKNYREEQKIGRDVRRPLLIASIFFWAALILPDLWRSRPPGDPALTFSLFFACLLLTFLYVLTLTVKFVTVIYPDDRIDISFLPFFKESLKMSAVTKMEIAECSFPGFGVRYDLINETTYYKASGNTGLLLILLNNKNIIIGTNKEAELRQFLNKIKSAPPQSVIKSLQTGPQQKSG